MNATNQELPPEQALQHLELAQCAAIAEILKLGVEVDAAITQDEVETLAREFSMLPGIDPNMAYEMLSPDNFFKESPYSAEPGAEPLSYHERLKPFTSELTGELSKISTLRLLAVLFASDGVDETEIDFYRDVSDQLDVDFDTAEQLLRAAWSDPSTAA